MKTDLFPSTLRRPHRRRVLPFTLAALAGACLFAGAAQAANVPIPNGDFSSATNVGTIGGGLLGASGTDVAIGSTGPWTGSYYGVLGLLAPPQLSIASGGATVGGLLGINVLGLVNNGGYFSQSLPVGYEVGKRYTITARISAAGVLDLGVLGSGNVGLALRAGGVTLASTATAPPQLISLSTIGTNEYQVQLRHDVTAPIAGNVDVQLLGTPSGLLTANLLGSITYTQVTLDASAIDPVAGSVIAVDGTTQSATVGQPFPQPLKVKVADANGDPVPGVAVTFAAPTSGAGAILSATSVNTGADGVASATATANTVAGSYTVSVSVIGVDTPATFSLVNTAGAPAAIDALGAGAEQSTDVATAFPDPLVAKVADAFGNPVPGVAVTFAVPTSGASAMLSADSATTDDNGLASVDATANALPGSYAATAGVAGVETPTTFDLSNTLPDGTTVDQGGGGTQSGEINTAFRCALEVAVAKPDGSPYAGLQVRFDAPASGASATLSDGVASGASLTVATGANGKARVQAIANDIEGEYEIGAVLVGADGYPPVTFVLRNIGSLIYADGFDTPCSPFP
ncbi:Ig-like domain-containing protein [Dokdonella sp.]|uniref:Ig-like domain-containing protein n=1 Tax=Dokdonella sp. TaxID=2291710 RepID=UPI001B28507F|nr:Ig-like domain-containing protein [Dokdonella sp.]MBO9662154.1 Ig-like domain-containing protein [Dokdonella sp.]